jgi:hypothetical protein
MLIPTCSDVLAGRPLTTGATAAPVITVISGAVNTLVDNGALTTTATAFDASAGLNITTPTGSEVNDESLVDCTELCPTDVCDTGEIADGGIAADDTGVEVSAEFDPLPELFDDWGALGLATWPGTTTAGVTEAEGEDAGLVPAEFRATTVNAYDVPFVRPTMLHVSTDALGESHVNPPTVLVAVYPVIALPPSTTGATQRTLADASPETAVTPVGAFGATRTTIAEVAAELGLSPLRFRAFTTKVYVAPVVRPETTQLVVVVTHVPAMTSVIETLLGVRIPARVERLEGPVTRLDVTVYPSIDSPPSEEGGSQLTTALVVSTGAACRMTGGPGTTVAARRVTLVVYARLTSPEAINVPEVTTKRVGPTPRPAQPLFAVPV